jgi:outer membrane receptor for ferrienterochelin and colicin
LQDEWKPFEQLTINFGGRFDIVDAFAHENQLSPRINIVYEPFKGTALHAVMRGISHHRRWKMSNKARSQSSTAQPTNPQFGRIPSRNRSARIISMQA